MSNPSNVQSKTSPELNPQSQSINPKPSSQQSQKPFHKSQRSLNSSLNNLIQTDALAATPCSVIDSNDEIWIEFLNSLNEPFALNQNLNQNCSEPSDQTSFNETRASCTNQDNSNDNDDATDDPDFTVCLENYDLDEPDYMDDWLQIPKKEAVELVKDAIEFCDGAPLIVYDDQRHSKIKSAITIKKLSTEINERSSHVAVSLKNTSKTTPSEPCVSTPQPDVVLSVENHATTEYVPEFTDIQRKQLNEQLRNHVQLLTQTSLICFCSKEFNYVYQEAYSLLNVLASLNRDEEENINKTLVSSDFEIVNLKDSLKIIEDVKQMDKEQLNVDLKQGIPSKFLEIIITSPVFYNTSLIPNLSKFKYQSHFKRSQFSDTEKILLIMGFNKFKHLPKLECCECIKEHLLPQRTSDDIRKQLNYFSNSEQRQNHLKELLKKQKQLNTHSLINYEFSKEIHYKSPYDQSEFVQLPSQYTIIIERIKLAKVLRDTRKHFKEIKDKNVSSTPLKTSTVATINNSTPSTPSTPSKTPTPKISKIRPPITKIATQNKRQRSQSPIVIQPSTPPRSPSPIVLSSASPSPVKIPEPERAQTQTQRIIINNNQRGFLSNNNQPTIILPSANLCDLFASPSNLINFIPSVQTYANNYQVQNLRSQPPVYLPSNFSGTVLIQPTIHIHTNGKGLNVDKYRQIKPKEAGNSQSPSTSSGKSNNGSNLGSKKQKS